MALLINPTNLNGAIQTRDLQAAARRLGLALANERDFEAFAELARLKASALVVVLPKQQSAIP